MATLFPTKVAPRGFVSTDPELAAVVRWPVLLAFLSAVHWMVVGTFLLVYASSLTHPQESIPVLGLFIDLSNHFSMFTYGRIYPAGMDALVYGWATTAGLGLSIWILARVSRAPIFSPAAMVIAVIFWNLGVAVGLTGIFLGDSSSVELLEFPAYASWILWAAYALFALGAIAIYLGRRPGYSWACSPSHGSTVRVAPCFLPTLSRARVSSRRSSAPGTCTASIPCGWPPSDSERFTTSCPRFRDLASGTGPKRNSLSGRG
jgi:hypothetical protein